MRKFLMSLMIVMGCFASSAVFAQEETVAIAGADESQVNTDEVAIEVSESNSHNGCGCGKGKPK